VAEDEDAAVRELEEDGGGRHVAILARGCGRRKEGALTGFSARPSMRRGTGRV
jgi:hypothetical protein